MNIAEKEVVQNSVAQLPTDAVTQGASEYKNFSLDNILHSKTPGDIHFNLYLPASYDGSEPFALYITLPGYQGLYFQGVGENIKTETFGFEAQKYNEKMLIVAPQLEDWGKPPQTKPLSLQIIFCKTIILMLAGYISADTQAAAKPYPWLWKKDRSCLPHA